MIQWKAWQASESVSEGILKRAPEGIPAGVPKGIPRSVLEGSQDSRPESPSSAEPKTWHDAHQWFLSISANSTVFQGSSDDATSEKSVQISSYDLEDALFQSTSKRTPRYHHHFYEDMRGDTRKGALQYLLFISTPGNYRHAGYWAPDVPTEIPIVRDEQIRSDYQGPPPAFVEIVFVGISLASGFVKSIGIVPVTDYNAFLRVSMSWWLEDAWDRENPEFTECFLI
jgi:hypothetical protein